MAGMINVNLPRGRKPRFFRERLDPIHQFDDSELIKRYRFDTEGINYLENIIGNDISQSTNRNKSLSVQQQILIALRYYATGKMQLCNGDDFGVHQSTVSRVINRITNSLSSPRIVRRIIKFPTEIDSIQQNQRDFYRIANFPGVIGCIDGTHVRIIAPSEYEESYVNRKNYHSINVQLVTDPKSRIIDIVARWPGSTHDARILDESGLARLLNTPNQIPGNAYLLGDSGYPCKKWLLTPFLRPNPGSQSRYNSAHKVTRALVERTIGQMKRRFHVLHGEVRLCPERACKTTVACAVLHNIAKNMDIPIPDDDDGDDNVLPDENGDDAEGHINLEGNRYRDYIVHTHFA